MMKQIVLQSCFLMYYLGIMTDEGFNIFYECAARCVHLFHQPLPLQWCDLV